jgi:rhodanese-related sulfurtransferase
MMKDLGYTKVAHMDGGFAAWKGSGKPVDAGRS